MAKTLRVVAPAGMSGLACEPSEGEVYAVAADWAQANSPVMVYDEGGWTTDEHGRQVADFRHRTADALASVLSEAMTMGGDEVESLVSDAVELVSHKVGEVADVLERHGSRFAGNNADDEAQGWLDNDFDADEVDEWCEVGCWDADAAASLRGVGLTPKEVHEWSSD